MKNVLKPTPDFTNANLQTSLTVVKLNTPALTNQKTALKKVTEFAQTEKTITPPYYDELHFADYE